MRNFKRTIVIMLVASLLLNNCSLFVPHNQTIAIQPTDQEAEVFVDGVLVGKGPTTATLKRNQSHGVVAKVGDRSGVASVQTEISTTGILDIIGGIFFVVPLIGLAAPGFWKLDKDFVPVYVPSKVGRN